MNDWRRTAKWLVIVVVLISLLWWGVPAVKRAWNAPSSSSPTLLSYTLCDGKAGPPGVKDFNSLPQAEADPSLCYAGVARLSFGEAQTIWFSYDNSRAPKNAVYGSLEGVSYDGITFVGKWFINNDWVKPSGMHRQVTFTLQKGGDGVFRGVYENYGHPGEHSQIVLSPR